MESFHRPHSFSIPYVHAGDEYLADSMFANRYHIYANVPLANNKVHEAMPVLDYQWLTTQHTLHNNQWLTAQHTLHNNILLEREKNFERIQQWLAHQHEYSGHPPPDEECRSSVQSSSLVETYSPGEEVTSYLPRYKSEEILKNCHYEQQDNFGGLELKKYYSPNLSRRRYSPRSDPTLNKTALHSSSNLFQSTLDNNREQAQKSDYPLPLNYYFYQSGKGNTFPRRNKLSGRNTQGRRKLPPPIPMGQQLERYRPLSYDERVMPNPYAATDEMYGESKVKNRKPKPRPVSMLEGRSFVLNGVALQGCKQENSSMLGNMSLDTQKLLSGNLPDVAMTAAKAIHKRELSDSVSKCQLGKQPQRPHHVRMSSAPEASRSCCVANEKVQLRKEITKRVPAFIRKVKAFSWPKRAILPEYSDVLYSDIAPLTGKNLQKTESGYNTEKSEEKLALNIQEQCIGVCGDDNVKANGSDCSDAPPERPPLPVLRKNMQNSQPSWFKSHDDVNSSFEERNDTSLPDKPLNEKEETLKRSRDSHQSEGCIPSCDRRDIRFSACSYNPYGNDLSKTVSMSLKDLIRIHEQEIARVSAGVSTCSVKDNYRGSRNSSLSETRNSTWKRHTTIGLIANYSLDHFQDIFSLKENDELFSRTTPLQSPRTDNDPEETFEAEHYDSKSPIQRDNASSVSYENLLDSPTSKPQTGTWPLLSNKVKNKAPIPFPKPKRTNTVIIEPSFINVNSAREQFATLASPDFPFTQTNSNPAAVLMSDVTIQTEPVDSFELNEERVENLTKQLEQLNARFDEERQELIRKLEEQKKVANAYQKLEDRYRKKVCSLKRIMRNCTCTETRGSRGFGNEVDRMIARQSLSPSLLIEENRDISVEKVEGILHQLEAWLNHQTGGIPTDMSEISSIMGGSTVDEMYPRYKLTSDYYQSPPLEIIDQIDATSV